MKIAIILMTLVIFAFFFMANKQDYHISEGEHLVNSILAKGAKIIRDKYALKPCGSGAAMPGGPIQGLTLCFDTKSIHTKEQLRELLIKSAQELLLLVNENNEIQGFIKQRPFNIKNVQIIIYNHDKNGRVIYDPNISGAQIANGILDYRTIDPEDSFKYKNEFEESYEEALKALSSPRSDGSQRKSRGMF